MSNGLIKFIYLIACLFISYLISTLILRFLIKRKTRGQVERDFSLLSHQKKDGTPTMGGIAIVCSSLFTSLVFGINIFFDNKALSLLLLYFAFFVIGFIDDYLKIKENSYVGLKGKYRLGLEAIAVFLVISILNININKYSYIEISFLDIIIPFGVFIIFIIIFVVVGMSNSVNLADGLDGLSSGMMLTALIPFIVISLKKSEYNITIILISCIGSLLAFLKYNIHPAKIFMGDCGALALGTLIAFSSIILSSYLVLLISCSFFVFETLSVIIQVIYFKKTGKRIFLMAPFHHHLEKKGNPEWKIVMNCWLYGLLCAIICIIIEVI